MLVAGKLSYVFRCEDAEQASHRITPEGYELMTRQVTSRCHPLTHEAFTYRVARDGTVKLLGRRVVQSDPETCVVSGRRPPGLVRSARRDTESAGGLFARMARLEAASVVAFELLAAELELLGAGARLLARVRRARADELHHAAAMTALAARFGAHVEPVDVRPGPPRGLLALALENAAEGCVRELYGALVARFQAESAEDGEVRAVLSEIADDEAGHAALAYDLASWLRRRLDPGERREVDRTRRQALCDLELALREPSEAQRRLCGLPSLAQARALVADLR